MALLPRRRLLILGAAVPTLWLGVQDAPAATGSEPADLTQLLGPGIVRDPDTSAVRAVFGLDPDAAAEVFQPATQADALPDGYTPGDLISAARNGLRSNGAQLVRSLILDDTRALIVAAEQEGHDLYVGSGFRSQTYQEAVFAAQTARWGDADVANRYSARPGHSQHQLGTTIDFTVNFRGFRASPAVDWLQAKAHQFGFVLPYTPAAVNHTGYIDEPWHARWVGASLAGLLQSAGYQSWPNLTADDAIAWAHAQAISS